MLPRFTPMPLARLAVPFDHPDWIFEVKYDGFRALAYIDGGRCELVSRNGNAYKSFGALCTEIAAAIPRRAVLDGEIVHLDAAGRPEFYALLRRRALVRSSCSTGPDSGRRIYRSPPGGSSPIRCRSLTAFR